jgi:transcriptional regulator GlxA family with amidase domain
MTENAANALRVPDVAAALGLSVRSLQQGFRQWRNTTPLQFLRQTRLRRVRDELCRSGGETEVTTVALRDGFMHSGRFSAYYQSAFGELPSTTLRRRRLPIHPAKQFEDV